MRIALIQARDAGDPALNHELGCFQDATGYEDITPFNLVSHAVTFEDIRGFEVVMIGGSGDYSISKGGFEWLPSYLELMRDLVRHKMPTFASCFGFQALVAALGGEVASDETRREVGTFELTLTPEGKADPLFGDMPETFYGQLGHNDSALRLPADVIHLVSSERCVYQALRVKDAPIVSTQFHPELTADDNIYRFLRYLAVYRPNLTAEQAREQADTMHHASPEASQLLKRFLASLKP